MHYLDRAIVIVLKTKPQPIEYKQKFKELDFTFSELILGSKWVSKAYLMRLTFVEEVEVEELLRLLWPPALAPLRGRCFLHEVLAIGSSSQSLLS